MTRSTGRARCARLGGEEFGVLPPVGPDSAHARAERFRQALADGPLAFDGVRDAVTCSIGCSGYDARRHGDAGALYRAADAALYRAKLGGRNRTERAD